MFSSNCTVCDSKNSGFIKEPEAMGLLSMIGKVPLLGKLIIYIKIASMNTLKNNHL